MKAATLAESVSINAEGRVLCLLSTHGAHWHHVNGRKVASRCRGTRGGEEEEKKTLAASESHTGEQHTQRATHCVATSCSGCDVSSLSPSCQSLRQELELLYVSHTS